MKRNARIENLQLKNSMKCETVFVVVDETQGKTKRNEMKCNDKCTLNDDEHKIQKTWTYNI